MDMNKASDYTTRPASPQEPQTRLAQIDADLHLIHWDTPQKATKAHHALMSIKEGLDDLASLGHNYHLVSGREAPSAYVEFPKMMTRTAPFPYELTVEDEEEESKAREDGYTCVLDGADAAQPEGDSPVIEGLKSTPVGAETTQPDPGAKDAVAPEVVAKPGEMKDLTSSRNLDKSIDGALGAPNNVNYQAPKPAPGTTDKDAVNSLKAGPQGSTPNVSEDEAKTKTVGAEPGK